MKQATILACLVALAAPAAEATIVRFETTLGNIHVRLFDTATPNSVANFLFYVNAGRYPGTFIHRVPQSGGASSNFVVQGGGFQLNDSIFAATPIQTEDPIGDEPGLTNIRGTLAFAKNSLGATSQWFFNIGDNSFLDDDDFTVLGRVIGTNMTIVDSINGLDTVNASAAENQPGEDYDEVPVTDLQAVLDANDVTDSEALLVNGVTVLQTLEGDFNLDGVVDTTDMVAWQWQYGASLRIADHAAGTPETTMEADANGDGVVDGADYTIWRDAFFAGSASAVPEPISAILAALGAASVPLRRR